MKTAFVTGGSGGIGQGICRALAAAGWSVYIGYHSHPDEALALAAELGGEAVLCDVRSEESVTAAFAQTGPVELLVNCAGIAWSGLFQWMSEEQWQNMFNVNISGMFRSCKAAAPDMIRRQSGCIINISSVLGVSGGSCEAAYSATKGAVISFTRSLAKELGPSGIRVNAICPGCIDTAMLGGFNEEEKADFIDRTALGRLGTPADIGSVAAFLASEGAGFITGQAITVDGGFTI